MRPARRTKKREGINRRQSVPGRECADHLAVNDGQCANCDDQAVVRATREFRHGSVQSRRRRARPIGVTSTPNEDATPWIAASWPIPTGVRESRRTATWVRRGATCLSSSSHLALKPYSNPANPVVLPPGRAKLATKPAPTGSITPANTIGTARVACCNAATVGKVVAKRTSGVSATNSVAFFRLRSA